MGPCPLFYVVCAVVVGQGRLYQGIIGLDNVVLMTSGKRFPEWNADQTEVRA